MLSFAETPKTISEPPGELLLIVVSVSACIIIVALLLGVLYTMTRKRAHGTTWFPEGFTAARRPQDGQEMKDVQQGVPSQGEEPVEEGAIAAAPEDWSDLGTPERPSAKRFKVSIRVCLSL